MLRSKAIFASLAGLLLAMGLSANAQSCQLINNTVVVDDDNGTCNTIEAAILKIPANDYSNSYTIDVQPGTYYPAQAIYVGGKHNLHIKGAGIGQTTVIFSITTSYYGLFDIRSRNNKLSDLTIINQGSSIGRPYIVYFQGGIVSTTFALINTHIVPNDNNLQTFVGATQKEAMHVLTLVNNIFEGKTWLGLKSSTNIGNHFIVTNNTFYGGPVTAVGQIAEFSGNLFVGNGSYDYVTTYTSLTNRAGNYNFEHNSFVGGFRLQTGDTNIYLMNSNVIDSIQQVESANFSGAHNHTTTGTPFTLP